MIDSFWICFAIGIVAGLFVTGMSRPSSGPPLLATLFDHDSGSGIAAFVGIGGVILIAIVVGLHVAYAYAN